MLSPSRREPHETARCQRAPFAGRFTVRLVGPSLAALLATLLAGLLAGLWLFLALVGAPAWAQSPPRPAPGEQPVVPVVRVHSPWVEQKDMSRTISTPAKGLFKGDQLTDAAKAQLTPSSSSTPSACRWKWRC